VQDVTHALWVRQGKTVEDIISQWDAELEKRSRTFMAHASALADWDRAILSNRQSLLSVEEQLRKVPASLLDTCSVTTSSDATFAFWSLKLVLERAVK
jgi:hypothetical protein